MLEEEEDTEDLYIHFAEFEEFCKEWERARAIFKYALDHVPKGKADALYARFVKFEKQHGNRDNIEEVLSAKKRLQVRTRGRPMDPLWLQLQRRSSSIATCSDLSGGKRARYVFEERTLTATGLDRCEAYAYGRASPERPASAAASAASNAVCTVQPERMLSSPRWCGAVRGAGGAAAEQLRCVV